MSGVARASLRRHGGMEQHASDPVWRGKPSWYLVATDDRMIPPLAQRAMAERAGATTTEAPGSHAIYVSQPFAVASLITGGTIPAPHEFRGVN